MPTIVQSVSLTHVTSSRPNAVLAGGAGDEALVHCPPSHRLTTGRPSSVYPTAKQFVADGHEIPDNNIVAGPGIVTIDHTLPFQCIASRCWTSPPWLLIDV